MAPRRGDLNWNGFLKGLSGGLQGNAALYKNCDFIVVGLQEAARISGGAFSSGEYVSHRLVEDIPNSVHIASRSIRGQTKGKAKHLGLTGIVGGNQRQQIGLIDCRKRRWNVTGGVSSKLTKGKVSEKGALAFGIDIESARWRNLLPKPRLVFASSHFEAGSPASQREDAVATEAFVKGCMRMDAQPLAQAGTMRLRKSDEVEEPEEENRERGIGFIMGDLNYRISLLRASEEVRTDMEQRYSREVSRGRFKRGTETKWELPKADLAYWVCDAAHRDRLFQIMDGFQGSHLEESGWTFPKPGRSWGDDTVAYPSYKRAYKKSSRYAALRNMLTGHSSEARIAACRNVYDPLVDDGKEFVKYKSDRSAWDFGWLDRIGYKRFGLQGQVDIDRQRTRVWEGPEAFLSDHVPTFMYIELDIHPRIPPPRRPAPDPPQF